MNTMEDTDEVDKIPIKNHYGRRRCHYQYALGYRSGGGAD